MLKIALITPIAKEYPLLGRDLKEGMQVALNGPEEAIVIHLECDRGINKDIVPAFRKAIIEEEVDLVIAFADNSALQEVIELIEQSNTPVIATGMGARLPLADTCEYLFYNTFRLWESCWLSGQIASNTIGKKIGSLSSFFDSGFPLIYAHTKGAESSGGAPVFFNITHKGTLDEELANAGKNMDSQQADYYFLSYFGKERKAMFDWLAEKGIDRKQIVATPGILMKNEAVFTVSSWYKDLDTSGNKAFADCFNRSSKHEINEFSMLGYETGLWIKQAYNKKDIKANELINNLKKAEVIGPRGQIKLSPKYQSTYAEHFIRTVNNDEGTPSFQKIEYPLGTIEEEIATNQKINNVGWKNTYLCT